MASSSIKTVSGSDTLVLFDRVFNNMADDDVTTLTFPNELVTIKTGKNKNTLYAKNEQGNNCELVLKLSRGSDDDKFLNSQLLTQDRDLAGFTLCKGQFTQRMGDGAGNITSDIYNLDGGVFIKHVEAKENLSGDVAQAVATYTMKFALGTRALS
jgi:hypothetical protein